MLGVTLFGIFLTPVFYFVIQWLSDRRGPRTVPASPEKRPPLDGDGNGVLHHSPVRPVVTTHTPIE
jgi:multidrug efflux pump